MKIKVNAPTPIIHGWKFSKGDWIWHYIISGLYLQPLVISYQTVKLKEIWHQLFPYYFDTPPTTHSYLIKCGNFISGWVYNLLYVTVDCYDRYGYHQHHNCERSSRRERGLLDNTTKQE
jgi:hypothetical protein